MATSDFPSVAQNFGDKALQAGGIKIGADGKSSSAGIEAKYGSVGAASGTGVSAAEVYSAVRQAEITLTAVDIALTDEAGVVAYGGLKIYDLPEGAALILGAVLDLDLTKSSAGVNDDWDGDIALGTATAGNDGTLSGTEANIVPSTATPQATSGATTGNAQSAIGQVGVIDGTGTAADVYLNVLVDDADHDVTSTPCNIIVNGTVKLTYVLLGDY